MKGEKYEDYNQGHRSVVVKRVERGLKLTVEGNITSEANENVLRF